MVGERLGVTEPRDPCATMPKPRDSRSESQGAPGVSMRAFTTMSRGEHLVVIAPAGVLERLR